MVDALGNLVRFILLLGEQHDSKGVAPLLDNIAFGALLADKAFDNDELRRELNRRGAEAVIPPKSNRKSVIACDFHKYRWRHLVEHYFCKLKAFRRIATRYEKTDESYAAMINLAGSAIALR